jgi:hypothetical protein
MEHTNIIEDLNANDLITYNFLFSKEKEKFAIVLNVKEDLNFTFMIEVLSEDGKIDLPAGVIEYRKISI